MSTSLYRKYRSQTFDELVGQEPVVRTLKNAITGGRIAHAYLFTGPRGVGKTSAARLLARAANCLSEGPEKPCNQCANCVVASREIATDLIEIDAASNTGVDNIREVIERANFAPSVWHTKFYVIDETHMLSVSAFNALLKTLEEPPPHTSFILATTEVHKVPATVASRCQRFDFRRIPLSAMLARLEHICEQEGIQAERPALELVARHSTGSLRDALSLLDQLQVYSEGGITLASVQEMLGASGSEEVARFVDALVAGDLAEGLRLTNRVVDQGLDLRQFNRQIVEHLRYLMLVKTGAATGGDGSLLDVTEEMRGRIAAQAASVGVPDLLRWIHAFADADSALRSTAYRQLPLELALVTAILKAGDDASAPPKDRTAELSAGIEQVGVVPKRQPAAQSPQPARQAASAVPPPIHSEFGAHDNGKEKETEAHSITEPDDVSILPGGEQTAPYTAPPKSTRSNGTGVEDRQEQAREPAHPAPGSRSPEQELARLRERWPKLVDHIKATSRNMAAVFGNPELTRPLSVAGSICTIGFRDPIHVSRSRMEKQRQIIEEALSWVMGYPCRLESVSFEQAEPGGLTNDVPASGANSTREKPSPYDTPRGKAAMNIFGISKFDDTSKETQNNYGPADGEATPADAAEDVEGAGGPGE